jgi:sulfate adenylyltransferase subunit 1 (EFTu-like GTPase family)
MDLVEFEQGRFEQIRDDFLRFASYARPDAGAPLADRMTVSILPISALCGDNVVGRSQRMPWFEGASLLDQLEACPDRPSLEQSRVRLVVQCVIRPRNGSAEQGLVYGGRMAAGSLSVGDSVVALPSLRRSNITSIRVGWESVVRCTAPASVSVTLSDDIGLARGDTLVVASNMDVPELAPSLTRDFEATVVWMGSRPLVVGQQVIIKHGCRSLSGVVRSLADRFSVQSLKLEPRVEELELNHFGRAGLRLSEELACDPYRVCRETGSFILIDEASNSTVGAGMIIESVGGAVMAGRGAP